jgi:chlorobactene glucosyltransferase
MLQTFHGLKSYPLVSVLVPSRNEEKTILSLLDDLVKQDYANMEIMVLDDQSSDNTYQNVKEYSENHPRITLISGKPLPRGWTGKNWACHQLSQSASGSIILFADADIRLKPFAVKNTVAWMQKFNLGIFTSFPTQDTATFAEKLIVPVIDIFIYCFLPLWQVYKSHWNSVSAANGQWIAFDRSAYEKIGGHLSVKGKIVEDVEISRLAKKEGINILVSSGVGAVSCRMYNNTREVWEGFSKNFYGLMNNNPAIFVVILSLLSISFILPYFFWLVPIHISAVVPALFLNLVLRTLLSVKFKNPFWISILLHPLAILISIIIAANSVLWTYRGKIKWKGRTIILSERKVV